MLTNSASADNPYIDIAYVENKALMLADKIFKPVSLIQPNSSLTKANKDQYDIIDAIVQDRRELVVSRLKTANLPYSENDKYIKSYVNLFNLSSKEALKTADYDNIKAGLRSENWEVKHLSALLLAVTHIKASDAVEALNYAELSLSVIPTEINDSHAAEKFYAHWVLYMSFVIDGDLNRTFLNIENMLTYAELSGRSPHPYDLLNNMAVVLDKNGDLDTAIKLTEILTKRVDDVDIENSFVANLSHGRFLLKADRYAEAVLYLNKALTLSNINDYSVYIHVDLSTAYAKLGQHEKAKESIAYIEKKGRTLGNGNKYAALNIDQPKALIAASEGNYEEAFNLIMRYSDRQIQFFKGGLSEDRREANRRVILTQEIAKKNAEKAELQSKLDRETLEKQKALGRFFLALILIGAVIIVGSVNFSRRLGILNKKLKRANATVKEKSKIKTELLAMFSHEMLTPLNGIVPLADILQRNETDLKKKKLLKMIEVSGAELTRKMKDIVLVANPQDQGCNPVTVDVEDFLHDNLVQFHHKKNDGVSLKVQMGRTLPSSVCFDVERVRAVIYALLSNALSHTHQGKVVLSLYLNNQGQIVIDVTDTGDGIASSHLEDMIKPFGQSNLSITRENQGLGLGLTIVRLQCHIMNAEFQMESEKGVGTTVRLTLPKTPQTTVAHAPLEAAA